MTTATATKKITLTTVKSFIKKNRKDLFINVKSSFDGMTDGCEPRKDGFIFASTEKQDTCRENTLGVAGAWFVFQSRDYFKPYSDDKFEGIEVSNACGHFILAVKKGKEITPTAVKDIDTRAKKLADEFTRLMWLELTDEQMEEAIVLNKTEEYSDGSCATHNFCDANMVMFEAFQKIEVREPNMDEMDRDNNDVDVWNKAWDIARDNDFTIEILGYGMDMQCMKIICISKLHNNVLEHDGVMITINWDDSQNLLRDHNEILEANKNKYGRFHSFSI